jgi:hypothetical protein
MGRLERSFARAESDLRNLSLNWRCFCTTLASPKEPALASSISELVVVGMILVVAAAASMVVVALIRGRWNSGRPA